MSQAAPVRSPPPAPPAPRHARRAPEPSLVVDPQRDRAVWAEEGPVFIPDIRQPGVRAQVRRIAEEQEIRLHRLLFAAGLHVIQQRD